MKKLLYSTLFTLMFVFGGALLAPSQTQAACSINGYLNSGGTCGVSFQNALPYAYPLATNYQNQYRYSQAEIANIQAYIRQLMQILQQLQQMQLRLGYGHGTVYGGSSNVDVSTLSARDIEDDRATLRGEVDFNNEDEATVYFEYGRSLTALSSDTTHIVLDDNDDESFSHIVTNLRDDTKYYFRAVAEDEDGRPDYGSILNFTTDSNGGSNDGDEPEATTLSARYITSTAAQLRGSVDMNDYDNGIVFFVYGEDENQVDDIASDYNEYNDIDEDGDDLQKLKLDSDLDNSSTYYANVSSLSYRTDIFFSICVEYDDDDNDPVITCGSTEDFTTGGTSSSKDEPEVDTLSARYITDDSAQIRGEIDMNDFRNGIAFFVYGEDEDQVDDISNDYTRYSDIDEDGDDLQKVRMDSDLDDFSSFYYDLINLDNDTDIFFAMCVEYEDEDNDQVILCGSTEDFQTDN